jgi:hypothetical protein
MWKTSDIINNNYKIRDKEDISTHQQNLINNNSQKKNLNVMKQMILFKIIKKIKIKREFFKNKNLFYEKEFFYLLTSLCCSFPAVSYISKLIFVIVYFDFFWLLSFHLKRNFLHIYYTCSIKIFLFIRII